MVETRPHRWKCHTKKREISTTQQAQVAEETTTNIFDTEYAFNTSSPGQNITNDKYNWIYDTGASSHMTPYLAILNNIRPCNIKIQTAAGITLATQIGTASIYQDDRSIKLHNTLYEGEGIGFLFICFCFVICSLVMFLFLFLSI
jgi:hypothetical protein